MSKNKSALIVIDAQNDFHDIPGAALPVAGATADTERTAKFIKNVNPFSIFSSIDSHHVMDIAHPSWWTDSKGNIVGPFTPMSSNDILNGKYTARIDPARSLKYVQDLEADGEFQHFIWPEHCLMGTTGQALHPVYFAAIREWMAKNLRWVNFINKGVNPFTEHFGIFRANVPLDEDPSTQVNQGTFLALNSHDTVYLCGQARTHCVANSLRQMLQIMPQLASKLVILEDCTSNVGGLPADFYNMVDGIYADAKSKGVQFAKSTDF